MRSACRNNRADNCSDYIKVQMNKRCSSCVFGCSDRGNHCGYACADMLTHDYRYRTAECDRTGCGKSLQNAYRGGRALNYCRQNAADNYRKNRIFPKITNRFVNSGTFLSGSTLSLIIFMPNISTAKPIMTEPMLRLRSRFENI